MNISPVSNHLAFGAKTKKGNDYDKSNTCMKVGAGVGLIDFALFVPRAISKFAEKSQDISKSNYILRCSGYIAACFAACVAFGALIDFFINKRNKKQADNAKEGVAPMGKTNKGKIIAASLSSLAVLSELMSPSSRSSLVRIANIVLSIAIPATYGYLYDSKTNKFGDKLKEASAQVA